MTKMDGFITFLNALQDRLPMIGAWRMAIRWPHHPFLLKKLRAPTMTTLSSLHTRELAAPVRTSCIKSDGKSFQRGAHRRWRWSQRHSKLWKRRKRAIRREGSLTYGSLGPSIRMMEGSRQRSELYTTPEPSVFRGSRRRQVWASTRYPCITSTMIRMIRNMRRLAAIREAVEIPSKTWEAE